MTSWDIHQFIGRDAETIVWWQMVIRAAVVFPVALVLVRFGGKRIFGKNTSFDIVLGVMLGSILSRALTGNAPLLPTVAGATTLVLLHVVIANVAFRQSGFGHFVKGTEVQLVNDGEILWDAMRKANVTSHDLLEAMRLRAQHTEVSRIRAAYLERNGEISFLQ